MKNTNLTTANPMLMIQRRNVYWVTKLKNQVRKTWGVTYVLLIMEEVLSIKMLNLKNKSHLYHLGRGGGRGEGGRGKGHSIFVVTISRVSQFSLVTPLNSVSDDWSYHRSICKPGDPPPPHPQDPLTLQPLFPSEKWWPIPYFCSALFREYKVNVLMPFLITFPFS